MKEDENFDMLVHHFRVLKKIYSHQLLVDALADARWGNGYSEAFRTAAKMWYGGHVTPDYFLEKYKYSTGAKEIQAHIKISNIK